MTDAEIDQIETYHRLLTRWNRTINLTALRLDPPDQFALDRLFVEPLAAAASVGLAPGRWIDLGSGGGSPAIPLKLIRPQLALTMVEARERKAAFLREAVRDLELGGAEVLNERFEALPGRRPDLAGLHLLVSVRAVRIDSTLMSVGRWLLAPGGRLFLFGAREIPRVDPAQFESTGLVDLWPDGPRLLILTAA